MTEMTTLLQELDEVLARGHGFEYRDFALKYQKQIRAALELQARVDDGWVMVPSKPTQAQFDSGFKACEEQYDNEYLDDQFKKTIAIYKAMINAAPPAQGEQDAP